MVNHSYAHHYQQLQWKVFCKRAFPKTTITNIKYKLTFKSGNEFKAECQIIKSKNTNVIQNN